MKRKPLTLKTACTGYQYLRHLLERAISPRPGRFRNATLASSITRPRCATDHVGDRRWLSKPFEHRESEAARTVCRQKTWLDAEVFSYRIRSKEAKEVLVFWFTRIADGRLLANGELGTGH